MKVLYLITVVLMIFDVFGSNAFSQSRKPLIIPFQSSNNIIFLKATVNGSKPLSFILDTGAGGSVINEKRAKELGFKLEGETEATTGDGAVKAALIKSAEVSFSGVKLSDLTLVTIDLSGLEAGIGRRIDGILSYDVFERYVVEFDYAARKVKLHEPKSYKYSGNGQVIPITIDDNRPFIRGRVTQSGSKSAEGKFEFDTGQVGAVTLGESFTTKNELLKSAGKTVQLTTGAILAGRSNVQTGRIQKLQLGGFVVNNPVTNFVQGNRGEADTSDYAGQIGGEILRRFRVVVDYSRKQVILEPNKYFSEPYEFDMSGASLTSSGVDFNVFRVRALIENSPATKAGLRVGDILTAINGKPTTKMTLEQIRRMLRRAGQTYKLSIKREETSLEITLKTRLIV
jgi:membrane-associated protease RseP (regulator of RpoE activity)